MRQGLCGISAYGLSGLRKGHGHHGYTRLRGVTPFIFTILVSEANSTQHPTLCGKGNEYRPKCGVALRLRLTVKARWLFPFVDKRVGGR